MAVKKENAASMPAMPAVNRPAALKANPLIKFLQSVQGELKKTDWPSRDELTKFTVVVMLAIFFVALYLLACDLVAAKFMEWMHIVRPVGR